MNNVLKVKNTQLETTVDIHRFFKGRGHFTMAFKGKKLIGCYRSDFSGTSVVNHNKTNFYCRDDCCHSEIKFLKMNRYRKNLHKLKIVNIKISIVNGDIIFLLAKPCYDCKETLVKYGINGIYFSTETGIIYEKIKMMETSFSSGNKIKRERFRT